MKIRQLVREYSSRSTIVVEDELDVVKHRSIKIVEIPVEHQFGSSTATLLTHEDTLDVSSTPSFSSSHTSTRSSDRCAPGISKPLTVQGDEEEDDNISGGNTVLTAHEDEDEENETNLHTNLVLAQKEQHQESRALQVTTTTTSKAGGPKQVRFSTVEFREYPFELGDSPAVTRGAPLTIGWDCIGQTQLPLEDYQLHVMRRDQSELKMPPLDRNRLLKRQGYSQEEIQDASRLAHHVRLQRHNTARQSDGWFNLQAALERVVHKIANRTVRRQVKRQEKQWLKTYGEDITNKTARTMAMGDDSSHRFRDVRVN